MITTIDMDELYDELQIAEFNDKAKTNDGKPLAIGNGKIVDHPYSQIRIIYILQVNVLGTSLINVHKTDIQ